MSRRITLTDRECQYIAAGLEVLKKESPMDYQVIQTGRQVYDDIIAKLKPVEEAAQLQKEDV